MACCIYHLYIVLLCHVFDTTVKLISEILFYSKAAHNLTKYFNVALACFAFMFQCNTVAGIYIQLITFGYGKH